jgi:hypothetical protein
LGRPYHRFFLGLICWFSFCPGDNMDVWTTYYPKVQPLSTSLLQVVYSNIFKYLQLILIKKHTCINVDVVMSLALKFSSRIWYMWIDIMLAIQSNGFYLAFVTSVLVWCWIKRYVISWTDEKNLFCSSNLSPYCEMAS